MASPILPDYVPVPQASLGPAVNDQGYYVAQVERNLYWVTDGDYHSAFLTTRDGVMLFDAPPTIGHNLQRAVDQAAAAEGVSNTVTHLVYTHHHSDHAVPGGQERRVVVPVGDPVEIPLYLCDVVALVVDRGAERGPRTRHVIRQDGRCHSCPPLHD